MSSDLFASDPIEQGDGYTYSKTCFVNPKVRSFPFIKAVKLCMIFLLLQIGVFFTAILLGDPVSPTTENNIGMFIFTVLIIIAGYICSSLFGRYLRLRLMQYFESILFAAIGVLSFFVQVYTGLNIGFLTPIYQIMFETHVLFSYTIANFALQSFTFAILGILRLCMEIGFAKDQLGDCTDLYLFEVASAKLHKV